MSDFLYLAAQFPITPHDRGGAAAVYYEQLASLQAVAAAQNRRVHLWHVATAAQRAAFDAWTRDDPSQWSAVQQLCASVTLTTLPARLTLWQKVQERLARRRTPGYGLWAGARTVALPVLRRLLAERPIALIWAQHIWSAQLALWQRPVPVIYSHHDWWYRVKQFRAAGRLDPALRAYEEQLARRATAVVSGSAVECAELTALGAQAHYLPVAYDPVPLVWPVSLEEPRIVHLGGMATTATQIGLLRFVQTVWPALRLPRERFWVIGDLTAARPPLPELLAQAAVAPGFVRDLSSVLRPGDLHIIPWEHATGQRTRVPVALNHGQVVVAVRAGVAGFPELRDGENCRLVEQLADLGPVLRELLGDAAQRERLSRAARAAFEAHFTRAALLPRYAAVVEQVLRPPARGLV